MRVRTALQWLDDAANARVSKRVAIVTGSGAHVVLRAGGPGTLASPADGPYDHYEVELGFLPNHLWARYRQDDPDVYGLVPRLLVTALLADLGDAQTWAGQAAETYDVMRVEMFVSPAVRDDVVAKLAELFPPDAGELRLKGVTILNRRHSG